MPFIEAWFWKMHGVTVEILRQGLPKRFKQDINQYAYLHMRGGLPGNIYEALYDSGRMPIPERHAHAMVIVEAAPTVGS